MLVKIVLMGNYNANSVLIEIAFLRVLLFLMVGFNQLNNTALEVTSASPARMNVVVDTQSLRLYSDMLKCYESSR